MNLIEATSLASLIFSITVVMYLLVRDYSKKTIRLRKEYYRARNLVKGILIEVNRKIQEIKKETIQTRIEVSDATSKIREMDAEIYSLKDLVERGESERELIRSLDSKVKMLEEQVDELRDRIEKLRIPVSTPVMRKYQIELNDTQKKIIDSLASGPGNYKDIQRLTGLSREHISRELKKLYELGFVNRDDSKRPYMYVLVKEISRV
ncbi:MAG: ArsR family transcriptional regulator [Candidatus Geothermarchaeales archaeon]